jgi:hypothetical protein
MVHFDRIMLLCRDPISPSMSKIALLTIKQLGSSKNINDDVISFLHATRIKGHKE